MRVFSGIQPTGIPHLGNYFGTLINWLKLQNEGHECFYSIVNQHAITVPQEPKLLSQNIIQMAATLLAVGIDPQKSTLFVQSDVPAHIQLAWILSCLAPMGQMERMIQYKEKAKSDNTANLGLFSYPVLQAADILIYKADTVPVGIDQAQHLELTRILAKKFNNQFKELFKEPQTLHTQTTKVVGLDGTAKMSKSKNNYISLVEDEDTIWKKLSVAATDPARIKKSDPGNPEICNIYSLHQLFSNQKDLDWVVDGCINAKIGCIDCKKQLFKNITDFLNPIRERYEALIQKPNEVRSALENGAKKANKVASTTLQEVYESIGFKY
ncbi:tryptophan--tRNA ligase [Candidatus Babeliales bacterium]|nr:tryptophan--tRNA ligase [Candidatus Babeliales bacterium]